MSNYDLVSFSDAVAHERIDTPDENDPDIRGKIAAASRLILRYLGDKATFVNTQGLVPKDSAGAPLGVPEDVRAAALMMFGYLYRQRDGDASNEFEMGYLPRPVTAMLYMIRKPTLA